MEAPMWMKLLVVVLVSVFIGAVVSFVPVVSSVKTAIRVALLLIAMAAINRWRGGRF
jgi:hypothetical protein